MRLTGLELSEASHGVWNNSVPDVVQGIGTDSRTFSEKDAFLALRGPSFDGHEHAAQVVAQASALIGDAEGIKAWQDLTIPQLQVHDTLQALGDIAAYHRKKLSNTTVIAITGSYGKTTVRSMLEHVLNHLGLEVAATQANLNNLIGVPQTLLAVEPNADIALIECGISEVGEMQRLSEIVQPDVAIVTGLTHAHGEGLGGLSGVIREKAKLMQHLSAQGWCMLGKGVSALFAQEDCKLPQCTLTAEDDAGVTWQLVGKEVRLSCIAETVAFAIDLPAKHWAEDMALVSAVVLKLADNRQQTWGLHHIAEALQTWKPVVGRMHVHPTSTEQDFTLIDDCYNANPASMQAALDTLAALDGHRLAILGDMLELGEQGQQSHAALDLHDIDEVWCVGHLMTGLKAGEAQQHIRYFANVDACLLWLGQQDDKPAAASTLLVKSSRSMRLDKLVDALLQGSLHAI